MATVTFAPGASTPTGGTLLARPELDDGAELTRALGLAGLDPVGLAEIVERADLPNRVDRKYLVALLVARRLVAALSGSHQALQISGRRSTTYRSTYFDTADLSAARAHLQGRRRRWKIRSRLYVEDQVRRLELKGKDGRGDTVKIAAVRDPASYGTLGDDDHAFLAQAAGPAYPDLDPATLTPTAEVSCIRATLADLACGTRVTIDWGVTASLKPGTAWIDPGHVIVETKGGPTPAAADRALLGLGARPRSFSKYVAAAASLHPHLPDNDVRALYGRPLHVAHDPS